MMLSKALRPTRRVNCNDSRNDKIDHPVLRSGTALMTRPEFNASKIRLSISEQEVGSVPQPAPDLERHSSFEPHDQKAAICASGTVVQHGEGVSCVFPILVD